MTSWAIFGARVAGRTCGHCRFCCTVTPVRSHQLNKPGGVRCQHLRSTGCGIYKNRPDVCAAWNCTWLYQPEATGLKRPDIGGYAIDPMPQDILVNGEPVMTIQVWCDAARRDAYRAPELRVYLAEMARLHRMPAIVRWPDGTDLEGQEATMLFAPCLTDSGEWEEMTSAMISEEDMARKLQTAGGSKPNPRETAA